MAIPTTHPTPIGESPAFQEMLAHVSRLAPLERPVLLVGERGTGKELIASRLNYLSGRWDRPFVKLNCAALPEALLDSELFGHEAGAFTGAVRRRAGRFELADGGTLLLDEIATASLAVQEKVLRVIEYGAFERVGGNDTLGVDVRVIAATNADLPALAASGRFRPDLLDRLAFDVVTLPPLRSRPEDIGLLAEHFATRMTAELKRDYFAGFAAPAMAALMAHGWPGNVRELRNVVERSVCRMTHPERALEDIVIDPFGTRITPPPDPLPQGEGGLSHGAPSPCGRGSGGGVGSRSAAGVTAPDYRTAVRDFETRLLGQALEQSRFNQRRAARMLGLTYDQLRHLLKTHGVPRAASV